MSFRAEVSLQLALVALFFLVMGAMKWIEPYQFRAAYLEGRFGLDHNTAMHYAFDEGREQCKQHNNL